ARLIRDSLGVHGGDEPFGADARKRIAINMKDVGVLSIASALRSDFLRCDTFDFSQQTIQQPCVFVAARSLFIQARELPAATNTHGCWIVCWEKSKVSHRKKSLL